MWGLSYSQAFCCDLPARQSCGRLGQRIPYFRSSIIAMPIISILLEKVLVGAALKALPRFVPPAIDGRIVNPPTASSQFRFLNCERRVSLPNLLNNSREFEIPAERVCELHLTRSPALSLEYGRR
jgi:hypothetical protein